MLPTAGLSNQVTAVFDVPVTLAVNIWVCEGVRLTLPGVNATLTEVSTLKFLEMMGLLSESLIANVLMVAEFVRAIGSEYGWEASEGELPSVV
jgi:hypothetical protein